ncbi:thioredoxin family protein [Candidatus Woesearchaeota archaeon]|nr:thioredoxin family protein [Candidatus Woesearchaeota archaeon]
MKSSKLKQTFIAGISALSLLISPLACNNKRQGADIVEHCSATKRVESLQQLENVVSTNERVIAYVGATWCIPCQGYKPVFEETAKDYGKDVVFCEFFTSDGWEKGEFEKIRDKYNFYGVPKTIVFKNGEEVHRQYSATKKELKGLIDHYFFGKEKPEEIFDGLAESLVKFCDGVSDTSFHIAVAVATDIDNDGKEDMQGYEQLFEKMGMKFEKGKPIEHYKQIMKERIINTPWKEEQVYVQNEDGKLVLEKRNRKCKDVYDACWSMFSENDEKTYRRVLNKVENIIEVKELKEKNTNKTIK